MTSKKKILVVEDDADVRLGYQILLKAHNYLTVFAGDSMAAISETRKHKPDLIILDLGLPAGDGFVVMERLKNNTQFFQIPIVVVSGRDAHGNRDRALQAGADVFIQKPWSDNELLATIAELLAETGQSSPHTHTTMMQA
jgi:chemosensory pili system protein ChpA (sensor histidine kinase/response regulator)